MKNKIKFTKNWNNKLDNPIFNTIRNHVVSAPPYEDMVGETFSIWLKDSGVIGKARLINVGLRLFSDIPYGMLCSDTGIHNYCDIVTLFQEFGMEDVHSWITILTFSNMGKNEKI